MYLVENFQDLRETSSLHVHLYKCSRSRLFLTNTQLRHSCLHVLGTDMTTWTMAQPECVSINAQCHQYPLTNQTRP